ncbi:MAG: CBS domain-containing protein [Actinomycetota bacterium]|nr:CBS domain-containing protein [Actinomycetota bacterium]
MASKSDWFACGMPREGRAADVLWAGDLVEDVPTCTSDDKVGEVRERVLRKGHDFSVVVNEEDVILGLLRGDTLAKDDDARACDVMELGPKTTPPSEPVEDLLEARSSQGVKVFLVATSHGVLLGGLSRDDAERALDEHGSDKERGSG